MGCPLLNSGWSAKTPLELTIKLDDTSRREALFGAGDCNLRRLRTQLGIKIAARDTAIKLIGEPEAVRQAAEVIRRLQQAADRDDAPTEDTVTELLARVAHEQSPDPGERLEVYDKRGAVVPKTEGQARYVEAMHHHDLTVCLGPAGTGKTYLAVAMAVSLLKAGRMQRIVLVRPAVEAGEKLGYLPGDMQAKVNPYLRPLFDAMHDMMSFDQLKRLMRNDVIEVVPLAFMRGRTLNSATVILDEAQNTTVGQMLMFLTRLGNNSRMIVTGDDSQVDLEPGQLSGLVDASRRLRNIKGISIVRLHESDIVRHHLVHQIVRAYNGQAIPPS